MRRLPVSLLCAALCLGLAGPALAQKLKIATVVPEGSGWMREMRAAAKEIRDKTDRRVKVKLYPGGVMGSEATVLRKMRAGQLHGGAFAGGSLRQLYPEVDLYSIPLMMRSFEEVDITRARLDPSLREGLERKGMTVLSVNDGGFAHVLSQRPVRTIAELRKSKVWLQESDVMSRTALELAGVAPVPLSIADVYTGLQTGLIDTVAAPPMAAIAFQWHTKVRFITDVPLMYLVGVLAVDAKAFARLRPEDQKVVRKVIAASSARLDQQTRAGHAEARQALIDQGITPVTASSHEELERWHAISRRAVARMKGQGTYTTGLIDDLLVGLQSYREQLPAAHER